MGEMDEVSLMQFYGQIFRELTFHSKATSEKQKGAVWVFGAEVSADWKTNLGIVTPEIFIFVGSLNLISGSLQGEMDLVIWPHSLGNVELVNADMTTWTQQFGNVDWPNQWNQISQIEK